MQEFIARQDCVITGHAGIVRKGDRIRLSARAAKYPRLKGWIEPAPAPKKIRRRTGPGPGAGARGDGPALAAPAAAQEGLSRAGCRRPDGGTDRGRGASAPVRSRHPDHPDRLPGDAPYLRLAPVRARRRPVERRQHRPHRCRLGRGARPMGAALPRPAHPSRRGGRRPTSPSTSRASTCPRACRSPSRGSRSDARDRSLPAPAAPSHRAAGLRDDPGGDRRRLRRALPEVHGVRRERASRSSNPRDRRLSRDAAALAHQRGGEAEHGGIRCEGANLDHLVALAGVERQPGEGDERLLRRLPPRAARHSPLPAPRAPTSSTRSQPTRAS